ncbi:proline-rich receptor-like protein kinase PERK14 [Trichoplusia ni]|uniref:Proline-rich receptor-like protein kinase PERK14 n=1 Tax=Trichoplusia ni TaxID=7111 RepID=A0A7E5W136_TRINI|nr:proline-rich receptor-like protein kinase PERK14 [Trichoplusia ni]
MCTRRTETANAANRVSQTALLVLSVLALLPLSAGYIDCRISCRRCHENTEHPSVLEVYCAMCEECKQRRRERALTRTSSSQTTAKGTPPPMSASPPLVHMRDGFEESGEYAPPELPSLIQQGSPPKEQIAQPPTLSQQQQSLGMQVVSLARLADPQQQPPQQLMAAQQQALPPSMLQMPPMQRVQRQSMDQQNYGWPSGCPTPPPCSDSEEEIFMRITTTTTTKPTCPTFPPCRKKKKPMMMPCMPCMPMCPCPSYTQAPNVQMMHEQDGQSSPADYHYLYIGLPKNALRS